MFLTFVFCFIAFFDIKKKVLLYLDKLVPLLSNIPVHFQKQKKQRDNFIESPPFDTPFPFIAMFFMRPPNSNLLMSPSINIRNVACDSFKVVPPGKNQNLRDVLYEDNEEARSTFRSRQIVLFPYKLSKKKQNGIPIQSVSCYKVKQEDITKENTIVELENATASNITKHDFHQIMALFGRQIDPREDVFNFVELFSIRSRMSDPNELLLLVKELGFPEQLIDIDHRVEVNMRNLGSFISMCSPIYFGAPEGQSRLEAVSRPCFGYPLFGVAPLRDEKSKYVRDFIQQDFFDLSMSLPPHSTAFGNVQGSVLYTIDGDFNFKSVEGLKKVSQIIQEQGVLEINTTYQNFYKIVVDEVSKQFDDDQRPLTGIELANHDLMVKPMKKDGNTLESPNGKRMTNLNKCLNAVLVEKIFTTRPFNLDLPTDPEKSTAKITKEIFKEVLENKPNWFVKKHFETIMKQDLPFDKNRDIKEDYFLPTRINKDLCSTVKLDPTIKTYKWGKSPSPTLLFEMMFAVFGYQPLLDTFSLYLQAFEGTSRFYHPLWLSLYVFLPVNNIANFYRNHYLSKVFEQVFTKETQGKAAPGKSKLFYIVRNVLLQEYFTAIIGFANKNKFSHIQSFKDFKFKQEADFTTWSGSTSEKRVWIAEEYLEMILLTLPENLYEHIKKESFKPFGNFDIQFGTGVLMRRPNATAERTNASVKQFDPLNGLPSLDNFLPEDIIPSLIMQSEKLATSFKTISLEMASTTTTAKRKIASPNKVVKKSKTSHDEETKEQDNDDYQQTSTSDLPPSTMILRKQTHLLQQTVNQKLHDPVSLALENQTLRLQIRLINELYKPLSADIESKHNLSNKLKAKMKQFGLLLNTIRNDENLFEPEKYTPDVNAVSTKDLKQFESFFTSFQEIAGQDVVIDSNIQKFLLFLYSTEEDPDEPHTYENFDAPKTSDDIRDHLDFMLKQRKEDDDKKKPAPETTNDTNPTEKTDDTNQKKTDKKTPEKKKKKDTSNDTNPTEKDETKEDQEKDHN
jgi:hypothetical protein